MNRAYISGLILLFTSFSLLCIAVFSLGTFFSGENMYKASEVYAENTALWYNTRSKAVKMVRSEKEISGIRDCGENRCFNIAVDDNRDMVVEFNDNEIYSTKLQYVGSWEPAGRELVQLEEEDVS